MWILQNDGSYINSNDKTWRVKRIFNGNTWLLLKDNIVIKEFNTLEQAIGAGPS